MGMIKTGRLYAEKFMLKASARGKPLIAFITIHTLQNSAESNHFNYQLHTLDFEVIFICRQKYNKKSTLGLPGLLNIQHALYLYFTSSSF